MKISNSKYLDVDRNVGPKSSSGDNGDVDSDFVAEIGSSDGEEV